MEEKILSSLGGVGIYGVISICIFFAFFAGILLWVLFLKKTYVNSMRALPLESEDETKSSSRSSESNQSL